MKDKQAFMSRSSQTRRIILVLLLTVLSTLSLQPPRVFSEAKAPWRHGLSGDAFARLIEQISEPEGYFPSDNFISNESSFLHLLPKLKELGISGGAYLGVGPDQNFTYIAKTRPKIAFILDIRRQNLIEHLLFKAFMDMAPTRAEFLSLLFGRPLKRGMAKENTPIDGLMDYLNQTPTDESYINTSLARARELIRKDYKIKLTPEDDQKLRYIYQAFCREGLRIQFRSLDRPDSIRHPTYEALTKETDLEGRRGHFLNSAEDYTVLRQLQKRNLIIPVVGDFGGRHALPMIAKYLKEYGERVNVFYVSNVEFYLLRHGKWDRYVANVEQLPIDKQSVFVRAYFDYGMPHPEQQPRYWMASVLQRIESFLRLNQEGKYNSYWDVATQDYIKTTK